VWLLEGEEVIIHPYWARRAACTRATCVSGKKSAQRKEGSEEESNLKDKKEHSWKAQSAKIEVEKTKAHLLRAEKSPGSVQRREGQNDLIALV